MKKCIIIANGKIPRKSLFPYLALLGYTQILCADGGANSARKLGVIPDFIIGDLDSITPENLEFFSSKTKVKRIKGQDDTDVEKCLKFAIGRKYSECLMLGVIGDRLDHSFGNLGIVKRYSDLINLAVISDNSFLTVHTGKIEIATTPGDIISLYGFDEKTKISSIGLKYELHNIALPFGKKEGTSNEALGNCVKLTIKNGKVFIIRDLTAVKKHGVKSISINL